MFEHDPLIVARVNTAVLGWRVGQIVTIARTDFVDKLIDGGRLTVLSDPESAAHDQGEEPADAAAIVDSLLGVPGEPPADAEPASA